jgi:hypothetical protein
MRVLEGMGGGKWMDSCVARSQRDVVQSVFQGHDQFGEYQYPVMLERRKGMTRLRVLVSLVT